MNRVATNIAGPDDDGVGKVQRMLDALALANGLAPDPVTDMQVALDEILSNILRNGFGDGRPHRIDVTLSVDARTLRAEIEDDCAPFDPLAVPPPDLGGSLQERRVGGLGIHFVRTLMDQVSYARADGRNRLVVEKKLVDLVEGSQDGSE